jgi:SAM-dependent methyltransferase
MPPSVTYGRLVPDAIFEHPRLVSIYDALDSDRRDLDEYVAVIDEFGAWTVLDIGCGTGTFALMLADRGRDVIAVEPAAGSLAAARAKPGAERVRWLRGDATTLPLMQIDIATMTGNVAQAICDPTDWEHTLRGIHDALQPEGRLIFETRDPSRRVWEQWTRSNSWRTTRVSGVGTVESWVEVTDVRGSLVTFRWTFVFTSDGTTVTSDSTLRFRQPEEIEADLLGHGYAVEEIRDAPDRPGLEFVFIARRAT